MSVPSAAALDPRVHRAAPQLRAILLGGEEPPRRLVSLLEALGVRVDLRSALTPDSQVSTFDQAELVIANGVSERSMASLGRHSPAALIVIGRSPSDAVAAFDAGAVDFVLEPVAAQRLARALERARARVERSGAGRRLVLRDGSRTLVLRPEAIDWVESAGNYVRVHSHGSHRLVRSTLASIESRLDTASFVRIHRRILVNLDRIASIEPAGRDLVVMLDDGRRLPGSRAHRERLSEALAE